MEQGVSAESGKMQNALLK